MEAARGGRSARRAVYGLTGGEAAKLLGISDGRTIRRWTGGDSPIPFAAWAILCNVAGLGLIWAKPEQ